MVACTGDAGPAGTPGPAGEAGTAGDAGTGCTVKDNGDNTYTVDCGGQVVTVPGGKEGKDGTPCTVADKGDGTFDVTCGSTTVTVKNGKDVDPAVLAALQAKLDAAANVQLESCAVCHSGGGDKHQATYDNYQDKSSLTATYVSAVSTAGATAGKFDTTITFSITKDGLPYVDAAGLPALEQKRFYTVGYDSATQQFDGSVAFANPTPVAAKPGTYTVSAKDVAYDITAAGFNGIFYAYVADGALDTEGMTLYGDVASAGKAFGTAATTPYTSVANVSGCEKCHGKPYMKHGYRAAEVAGLGDFAACKTCHYDSRNGGHKDWQILVDDPARYAELDGLAKAAAAAGDTAHDSIGENLTAEENTKYAYKANVMNDVHMSHAMEFPYPQSMANCATCHEGKLDKVLTDANFVKATCISCHPMKGSDKYGTADRALETIWTKKNVAFHIGSTAACNDCHKEGGSAKRFTALHGGYDKKIYTAGGALRYSEVFKATVDAASFDSATSKLTVEFSATEVGGADAVAGLDAADIIPTVLIGLYGYNTKDFIVAAHGTDTTPEKNRLLEFAVDGVTTNPRFTVVTAADGKWKIVADLSMWAAMIADGKVKRAEISVMPRQSVVINDKDINAGTCTPACARGEHCSAANACVANDDMILALDAPSRTFSLATNAFDDAFFKDIVDVKGCNACHDALATTFHSGDRGGSITVCRQCHVGLSGGSHLEMQSRSIDSYVHAVHSFQAFDPGDTDFADPVEAIRYKHHIEHKFPNFTIKNCESCHKAGTYNVPDPSRSMPGKLSGSDKVADRNIGTVPSYVTGPAARACGACHRSHMINEDDAGKLAAFFQHTKANGYLVEDDTGVLDKVIETIMSMF